MQLKTPKFWIKKNLISCALWPFSLFYLLGLFLKNSLTKETKISKPVICIGNLIAGGSGKTPTAIEIGRILYEIIEESAAKKSFQFAYLSRGYMGDGSLFLSLRDSKHSAENVGDEPMLLIEMAPTFVAKKRLFGAKQIEKIKKIDAIVLDDGMQDHSLFKDFTILVVDGKIGFGNEFLIPAGPMREPLKSGIKRADLVVVIGEIREDLQKKLSSKKIVHADFIAKNLDQFKGKKLMAFCGLAYPQKFFSFLLKNNLELVEQKSFPDHYHYQEKDLENLCKAAEVKGLKLITTKKDWVKFPKNFQDKISYLDIELRFLDKNLIKDELKKVIRL